MVPNIPQASTCFELPVVLCAQAGIGFRSLLATELYAEFRGTVGPLRKRLVCAQAQCTCSENE